MEILKVEMLNRLAKLIRNYETGFIDEAEFCRLAGLTVEQAHTILES